MEASWKERWDLEEDAHPCNPTNNPTFASVLAARLSRRSFLKETTASLVMFGVGSRHGLRNARAQSSGGFMPVSSSSEDKLIVPPGYVHTVLLRWGDPLATGVPDLDPLAQTATRQAQQFGYNCDFIGYLPLPQDSHSSMRGLLGVNHEATVTALMVPGWDGKPESTTLEMVDIDIAAHGFSIVEVVRDSRGGWTYVRDSAFNRRITGATPMTIRGPAAGHPLMRTSADPSGLAVLGTLNNCAGGVTPWGTVLTGEENIWLYFTGKVDDVADEALRRLHMRYRLGTGRYVWGRYHDRFDLRQEPHEPNRFGWVVEIDPYDPRPSRSSIPRWGGWHTRAPRSFCLRTAGPLPIWETMPASSTSTSLSPLASTPRTIGRPTCNSSITGPSTSPSSETTAPERGCR